MLLLSLFAPAYLLRLHQIFDDNQLESLRFSMVFNPYLRYWNTKIGQFSSSHSNILRLMTS